MEAKIWNSSLLLLTIFLGSCNGSSPSRNTNEPQSEMSRQLGVSSYSGKMLPVQKYSNQYGNCYAYAPANWMITGSRKEGDALDLFSADGSLYAGYLIVGVQGGLTTGFYSQMYATPETYLNNIISENGTKAVTYEEPIKDDYGYTILPFEIEGTPAIKGVVFYKTWPVPGDPNGYVLVMRMAKTLKPLWESQGANAIAVSLSIRGAVQLRSSGSSNTGSSEERTVESGYNVQLGMEYVHDPDTGENYWVNPSQDYDENGNDGPGYYKQVGFDIKKLSEGRSDD